MIIKECNQDYLSETGRRIIERTADRHCKDKYLHSFKYACNENHNNRFKRKILEELCIKQYKPLLNTQQESIPLKPFN